MREFLIAIAIFGTHYHCGQADPWYARQCLAREYLLRWYQISSPEMWFDSLAIHPNNKAKAWRFYQQLENKYA